MRGVRNTSRKGPACNPKKTPLHIGHYLAGFADGEGSFNVSFRRRLEYSCGWKVSLCFNISQREKRVLTLFKKHLACGTLRRRSDGVWYHDVNSLSAILDSVIPFFERFLFLSAKKKRDFSRYKRIALIVAAGEHFTEAGIRRILRLRRNMNDGGKRRYSEQDILRIYGKSSETIRQAVREGDR